MSLQTRLGSFITAVGTDVKALKAQSAVGEAVPPDFGWDAWNFDPGRMGTSATHPTNLGYFSKLYLRGTSPSISSATFLCTTAGATITNCGAAIYNADGTNALLASQVNTGGMATTAFTTTGFKTATFTPFTPVGDIYVVLWFTASTMPALLRIALANAAMANPGLTAPNLATGTIVANSSSAPSPMGTQTGGVTSIPWCAVA